MELHTCRGWLEKDLSKVKINKSVWAGFPMKRVCLQKLQLSSKFAFLWRTCAGNLQNLSVETVALVSIRIEVYIEPTVTTKLFELFFSHKCPNFMAQYKVTGSDVSQRCESLSCAELRGATARAPFRDPVPPLRNLRRRFCSTKGKWGVTCRPPSLQSTSLSLTSGDDTLTVRNQRIWLRYYEQPHRGHQQNRILLSSALKTETEPTPETSWFQSIKTMDSFINNNNHN
jgi:hypothetical protein